MDLKKRILIAIAFLLLGSCSVKVDEKPMPGASGGSPDHPSTPSVPTFFKLDLIQAETITTANAYDFRLSFQETSEKQATPNGYQFEGTFYAF